MTAKRRKRRREMDDVVILVTTTLLLFLAKSSPSLAYSPPVPDDCSATPLDDGKQGLALTCSLSAINSEHELTNFSVVPSEHTHSLTVKCRDGQVKSRLQPDGFVSLFRLRELAIEDCNLQSIPARAFYGLRMLKSLRIKTSKASNGVSVSSDAFLGLNNLEQLDLSWNSIQALASNALCPLAPRLQLLNLSHNAIGSLADLGSSLECLHAVRSLDLSFNSLSVLSAGSELASLNRVQELRLNDNFIRNLKGNVLKGKDDLRFLDLSNNRLDSLAEETFSSCPQLARIDLSNNSLSFLPKAIFRGQTRSLAFLDLSGNRLSSLQAPLLTGLQQLTSLDLSRNELVSVESASALRGLSSLRTLKLSRNKLFRLPSLNLPSLRALVLSENDLGSRSSGQISARLLSRLPSISHLHLDSNEISELPKNFFKNSSGITVLDLSNNRLRGSIPEAVNSLVNLQSFDIGHNYLDSLSNLQLRALWRFQASGNRLGNVSADQLRGLPVLQVVDFSSNRISVIEKNAFAGNEPLQAIRLDDNQLTSVANLFTHLPNLNWLNVSANKIEVFDYAMVPKTLTWLDLHQNELTSLENYFGIGAESQLSHVDASFNRLRELGPQNVPQNVETFLVNDNTIETLVPYTFFKTANLKKVDLSVNRLESIERNTLRLASEDEDDEDGGHYSRAKFLLGGNPIRCDCHMAWFKTVNEEVQQQNFPFVADLESIYCQLLNTRQKSFVPLVDAASDQFLCTYKTHCFALCHCCEYDACDCEMTCPDNCTCYHDTTWTKNIAECSNAGFTNLPEQLPMDATEIFLDGNNIIDLESHTFIGRKNLKVLFLNNTLLTSVENHTFNGLNDLEVLHLESNSISRLQGDEFHGLSRLRELYLHDNLISTVNNATFASLKSLQVLSLQGNRISDFPVWRLAQNQALSRVALSRNPWTCECLFLDSYRRWLSTTGERVIDAEAVICRSAEGDFPLVDYSCPLLVDNRRLADRAEEQEEEETSLSSATIQQKPSLSGGSTHSHQIPSKSQQIFRDFLPVFLGVLSAVILVVVIMIAVFIYRDEMRLWLYSKYGVRFFHRIDDGVSTSTSTNGGFGSNRSDETDALFDAFVAYSAKDDAFVRQMLAPELEFPASGSTLANQPLLDHQLLLPPSNSSHTLQQQQQQQQRRLKYKLCLFYRDLPVHHPAYQLSDTIVQASEAARRTVLVLSEHLVKSEWARYDFKSGLHQALNGRKSKKRLIVIVLGDIAQRKDLDPDLRLYLKTGVVLHWGDKLFWEKLRYALPDLAQQWKQQQKLQQRQQQHQQPDQMMAAFSPDNDSFRYETYHHQHVNQPHPHHQQQQQHHHPHHHHHHTMSMGGGSSIYQSVGTPDEQDSTTRTMTIHI